MAKPNKISPAHTIDTVAKYSTPHPASHVVTIPAAPTGAAAVQRNATIQAANKKTKLQTQAQTALDKGDRIAMRCLKAGVPYPTDWAVRDEELRLVKAAGAGTIPPEPAEPTLPAPGAATKGTST